MLFSSVFSADLFNGNPRQKLRISAPKSNKIYPGFGYEACVMGWFFKDKRPAHEQERDKAFIKALNSLKTLQVTPRGGMSIDPDEIRDQFIASRLALAHLVQGYSSPAAPVSDSAASGSSKLPLSGDEAIT